MDQLPAHSYEELREVVIGILLRRESVTYEPIQYQNLVIGVGQVLGRRSNVLSVSQYSPPRLNHQDIELVRDVFWDLFRQGFITLGLNDSNENWPFFRLSRFGEKSLAAQSPYRFHDTGSFIALVTKEVPDISPAAIDYLSEAVAAFYADCRLSACVMLGVAAEAEFLRLVDVSTASHTFGPAFSRVERVSFIRQKIVKFQESLRPLLKRLPQEAIEDIEANFTMIQSVLRIARNEAGHPAPTSVQREQVYVYLQLFVPFARQLMRLRKALA